MLLYSFVLSLIADVYRTPFKNLEATPNPYQKDRKNLSHVYLLDGNSRDAKYLKQQQQQTYPLPTTKIETKQF